MAYSRVGYTANGTQAEFSIPFGYLNVNTLFVRVNNIPMTMGVDYSVDTSANKIVFPVAPVINYPVTIRRVTPRGENERLVVFTDPSDIRAEILNSSDLQLLYILQEALDDIELGVGVGVPSGPLDPDAPVPPNVEDALDGINTALVDGLLAEANARVAAILAEHNDRVAALLAESDARDAAILNEQTVRQTAIDSLVSDLTVINARIAETNARITYEDYVRAEADEANAVRIETIEAIIHDQDNGLEELGARLTTVEGALSSGEDVEALAFRVSTIEAWMTGADTEFDTITALVSAEELARVNAVGAVAAAVNTVSSTVDDLSATVSTTASTQAGINGTLAAEYVLQVATNGPGGARRITGFRITNQGGAGGGTQFVVQTDQFVLVNSSGEGARIPFQVIGGSTYIDEAVIRVLSAGKITSGSISGQDITLSTNGSTLSTFKSSNYIPGSSGFMLRSDGYLEVHNGVFRGSVVLTNSIPAGNVSGLAATATTSDYSAISGSKPPSNADVTISAINGGLYVTGGGLVLAGSPVIQSYNYSAGNAGWSIKGDGSVEFSNGVFRGTLKAPTVEFALRILSDPNSDEGGELLLQHPDSAADWHIDVSSSGNMRFFKDAFTGWVECQADFRLTGGHYGYGNFTSFSSLKFKENVTTMGSVLAQVLQLRATEYDYKPNCEVGTGHDVGFIAEEMAAVFPQLVVTSSNGDKAINYAKLSTYLVKAIQELHGLIAA